MSFVGVSFLLLVSVVAATNRTLENSCPSGVLGMADPFYLQVYDGSCYHFVKNKMRTFGDASADCRKYGGTLALPKTQSLNDYLTVQSSKQYKMLNPIWIGLHDLFKEKEFVWQDNSKMEWSNFAKGNGPDNNIFRRGLEDCVAIDPTDDGLWHDYQCNTGFIASVTFSKPKKMYICQYTLDFVDNSLDFSVKKEDQGDKEQQDKDQQDKDQKYKDQQDKDQQDKDQQDKDQQDKDQQDKDQKDKD
ncbi:hypothetical protein RRG08_034847 [Elysia crispata]|uniref:C-type lectin domain-containing protein n=1 Tax=Elysia crispata TaxID=231223 RepID=A0AAE1AN81_9GAST|nr:hypothetical protein RRG08_034847 [Elysia crispata]